MIVAGIITDAHIFGFHVVVCEELGNLGVHRSKNSNGVVRLEHKPEIVFAHVSGELELLNICISRSNRNGQGCGVSERLRVINDNSATVAQGLKGIKDVRPLGLGLKLTPGKRQAVVSIGRDSKRDCRTLDAINGVTDGVRVPHDSPLAIADGGRC